MVFKELEALEAGPKGFATRGEEETLPNWVPVYTVLLSTLMLWQKSDAS